MGVTVGANMQTVIHKGSGGTLISFPDVCLTPVGNSVPPIPYSNIGKTSDMDKCAETVTADGNPLAHEKSVISKTTGDEPGNKKGVSAGTIAEKGEFATSSFDVEVEGTGITRAQDLMIANNKNTPPSPLMQPPHNQTIQDETPVIPEQGKITVTFFDPFGNPMKEVPFETEIDNIKEEQTTDGNGQLIKLTEKKKNKFKITNHELGMKDPYLFLRRLGRKIKRTSDEIKEYFGYYLKQIKQLFK